MEKDYLKQTTPQGQSGYFGTQEDWKTFRQPIAAAIHKSGTFLDIGCANGYLLECLCEWIKPRGLSIIPFGLDFSEKLIGLARQRLPEFADNFFCAYVEKWVPPQRFDFVKTDLGFTPQPERKVFLEKLLSEYLLPRCRLILTEYRSSGDDLSLPWLDHWLTENRFNINGISSGISRKGLEFTRVVWIDT